MKHTINLNGKYRTNLLDELTDKKINLDFTNIKVSNNNYKDNKTTTIYFKDITDKDNYKVIKNKFKTILKKYIKGNKFLIIGLGNSKITFDSLGPNTLNHILVTNHLKEYLDKKFKLVSKFYPNVTSLTGIDNYNLVKKITNLETPDMVIIIDSLIGSKMENITKCIQVSNIGLDKNINYHNYTKSLNAINLKYPVIIIGIPCILETDNNLVVTTKDIDLTIEKSSKLIGESLNEVIHNYSFDIDTPS